MSLTEKVLRKRHLEECGGGSANWNDIQNKPFGDNTVSITWDGDIVNRDVLEISYRGTVYQTLYKVSDFTATYDELKSEDNVLNGSFTTATGEVITKLRRDTTDVAMATDNCNGKAHFIIVNELSFDMSDGIPAIQTAPSTGIYFAKAGTFLYSGVTKIEEKFIPNVFVKAEEKGQPEGVASLGLDGKIPASQMPEVTNDTIWLNAECYDETFTLQTDMTATELTNAITNKKNIMISVDVYVDNSPVGVQVFPLYGFGVKEVIIDFIIHTGTGFDRYYRTTSVSALLNGCDIERQTFLTKENIQSLITQAIADANNG